MMNDYDLYPQTQHPAPTDTVPEPSQQVVRNILNFARCCQLISVGDITLKVYLN